MSRKHRKTFDAIFHRPTPANIPWKDIESLLLHLGAEIIPGKGSRISVVLEGEVAVFHRPHPRKEADRGSVVAVGDFLKITGANPC